MRRYLMNLLAISIALEFAACASKPAPARAVVPEVSTVPGADWSAPIAARARMLMLEDERRFSDDLLAAARAGDPSVRAAAAHALGSIADPRGISSLKSLTLDADAGVREEATLGLAIMGDAETAPAVAPLLRDRSSAVACAAARALVVLGGESAQGALVSGLRLADPSARPCFLYALGAFPDEEAAAAARGFSSDPDILTRRAAIYGFSRSPVPSSREAIIAALAGPDGDAAAFAARGLGLLKDPAALPALENALGRREPDVLVQVLVSIGQIETDRPTPLAPEILERVISLARDADPNVAVSALYALRNFFGNRSVFSTVDSIAASGSGPRQQTAFLSELAALRENARGRFEQFASSPDPALRAAAARGLVFLPDAAAAPYREQLLADPRPTVREAALNSLPPDAAHRARIETMLADPDAGVRSAAMDRLSGFSGPEIVPEAARALEQGRGDPIADAAISALNAAVKFHTEAVHELLRSALTYPRTVVAKMAWHDLVNIYHDNPAALPPVAYDTGRTPADYGNLILSENETRVAVLDTGKGKIMIALDSAAAPLTVANFVALARKGFFDGTAFDRVVPGFVIQGGDPTGTLHGGPGYEIRDEINNLAYRRGTVGMALGGADTGGSQFFITLSPQPHLDDRYPIFGSVVAGEDVVERIAQGDKVISVKLEP